MTAHAANTRLVRQRGAAYLLVIFAMAIGTTLAGGFLVAQRTATAVAANFPSHTSARGVAESGMALALNYLQTSDTWRTDKSPGTWVTNQALAGGTFTVTVSDATSDFNDDTSQPVTVAVTGTVNGVSHIVYASVTANATEEVNNTLLLVVDSTTSYDVMDQRKIDLFEGWGYTVTLAAHNESQADLTAAADAAAVVYISESVGSGTLGTKLRDVTVGVVCDEAFLVDEFRLATDATSSDSGTQLNILNNIHPVTSGLSTGSTTVASSSQNFARATGVAAGVTTLAQGPGGNAGLLVADAGAALTTGTATGRRVFYPGWDNWNLANTNATVDIILRQALEWAAGGNGVTKTWTTTFDADPTASDPNGDGTNDFAMRFGGSPSGVSGGIWADAGTSATTPMDTAPNCDFDRPTRMSARMRATSIGGRGASIMINFDYDGTLFSPVIANLILQGDNTQTLELYGKNGSGEQLLHTVTGLDNGFHDIQLDLDPDTDQVRLTINGSIEGWFNYFTRTYSVSEDTQRFATLLGWMADAEFDDFTVIYNNPTSVNDDMLALVVCEFNEPPPVAPTLVSHWQLDDDTSSGGGASVDVGKTTNGSSGDTEERNQAATQVVFTDPVTVTSITARIYGGDDGGVVRYAIYDDNSGTPGNRLAQSGTEGLSEENWRWETEAIGPITLPAGTYWLALSMDADDGDARYSYSSGGNTHHHGNNGVSNFNNPWGTSSNTYSRTIAIYASGTIAGSTDIVDIGSAGNDGTVTGATSGAGGFGDGGTSFQFDGSNDFIEVPHNSAYLLDEGAISFWFRADNTSGRQGLISKDSQDYDDGGHLDIQLNGSTLEARIQSTSSWATVSRSSVTANAWHHVLVTWGPNGFQLYFNGTLADSDAWSTGLGTSSGGSGNANPWTFGVGQSLTGDNTSSGWDAPYDGRLDEIRLYGNQLDATQAANLAAGSPPGNAPDHTVYDTSGFGTPLDLIPNTTSHMTWGPGGLTVTGDTLISSPGAATKLYDAITTSGEFTVILEYTPTQETTDNTNPDRVITYSDSIGSRNFLLGQNDDGYEVRIRTTATANNGDLSPLFVETGLITANTKEHWAMSYDGSNILFYRNGTLQRTQALGGLLSNWDSSYPLNLADEVGGSRGIRGTFHRVAIYDNAFDAINAQRSFNGQNPNYEPGEVGYEAMWMETNAP
ncbi:MAG: LamG domain-containing protein [Planctomycetota bacterium]